MKAFFLTMAIAMVPIIELRGAIPYGISQGLPYGEAFIAALIGNIIPVPIIILGIRGIFDWMRKRFPKVGAFVDRLESRGNEKAELVRRYKYLGLLLLVAIPLPGTGAWTGSLVAALLNLRVKYAGPVILLGVAIAGGLMVLISHGFVSLL